MEWGKREKRYFIMININSGLRYNRMIYTGCCKPHSFVLLLSMGIIGILIRAWLIGSFELLLHGNLISIVCRRLS